MIIFVRFFFKYSWIFSTYVKISIWNLVYTSSMRCDKGSSFIPILTYFTTKSSPDSFSFIPEVIHWDIVIKLIFGVAVILNALYNIHYGFYEIPINLLVRIFDVWSIIELQ